MTKPTTHTFCKDKKGRRCTVAIRQATENGLPIKGLFNIAEARTSLSDNFSKAIGRRIVYGRLDKLDNADIDDVIPNVVCYATREDVIYYLTYEFDISEKRAILMIDKDLLKLPPPEKRVSQ